MKRSRNGILILFTLLLLYPAPSKAKNSREFVIRQKKVMRSFFLDKRYFDCIAEARRLLSYTTTENLRDEYLYFIEANYYLGGQYRTVISHIREMEGDNRARLPYLLLLSRSYMKLGMDSESLSALLRYDYARMEKNERRDLFLARIETYLKNSMYPEALSETHRYKKFHDTALNEMEKEIAGYREIALKSKELSVILSAVVPGSGQLYSGRIADGFISLAAVLACSGGAYYFYQRGNSRVSFTLVFFSALFYGGNIYGAYNAAEAFNRRIDEEFRKRLIGRYIPPYEPMRYIPLERILE